MKIVKHKFDSLLSHSYENEFRLIVLYKRVLRLRNFEEPPLFRLRNWNVKRIYILLCIYSVIRNIKIKFKQVCSNSCIIVVIDVYRTSLYLLWLCFAEQYAEMFIH